MISKEEAIEKAKEVIQKTDKGNLDIYQVPIHKYELKELVEGISSVYNLFWIITFKRYLHSSRMYYVWEVDSIEEG